MLKKTALIAILVGSSVVPVAWGQDDPGSDDDSIEASDESVQMVLPPKPGAGPKVTDTFESLDQILNEVG